MFLKSKLSKVKFFLGKNPKIEKKKNWRKFIPEPYQAVVTITADFELAWAWQYAKDFSIDKAENKAQLARENIPKILDLCDKYNIPITWATVGHLFLKQCNRTNNVVHPSISKLNHFENQYWKFSSGDWFKNDPCTNYKTDSEWYAPDLIEDILSRDVDHEIGCHTFSHIDCSNEICPQNVFNDELIKCKNLAQKYNLKLKSFVHPGHTIGHLDNLVKLGFSSFQTDYGNTLGFPVKHQNGLWEIKRTYEFIYRKEWSIDYHIYRYKKIIDRAIKTNTVCNFWFHPSFDYKFIEIMKELFYYIQENRKQLKVSITSDYIDNLNRDA